jgi:hypothetical protein
MPSEEKSTASVSRDAKIIDVGFIVKKVKFLYANQGILGPIRALGRKTYAYGLRVPVNSVRFFWANVVTGRPRSFSFQGESYNYLNKALNNSWRTERNIEIPLVAPYFSKAYGAKARVLEVGDTMRQYSAFKTHDILDKYEYRKGLMNIDIVDFKPTAKYDLIVSVSTMEHVGWDWPDERDPEKLPRALGLMRQWLAPHGVAVVTMPIGWNTDLDKRLRERPDSLHFTRTYFLTQISKDNEWREATREEALTKKYGTPFEAANALIVGIIDA